MLKLNLLRHAKSDWQHENLSDFERPLNNRGLADIAIMSHTLEKERNAHWLASSAYRTYQTSTLMAKSLNIPLTQIHFNPQLYHATAKTILSCINGLKTDRSSLVLVGHNNGISELANKLCDEDFISMPTCALVQIELELNHWQELSFGCGSLKQILYPKMFK